MDYASLTALAEDTKTSAMKLSGSSIALLFNALGESAEIREKWSGSGDFGKLTDAEWDEIERIIALAEREIMSGLTGVIEMSVKVPAGALECDGSLYQRVDYPSLYDFLAGTSLIVDGDSFNVPDFRFKVPVGRDTEHPELTSGGEAEHTLTESEMPAHSHTSTGAVSAFINGGLEAPAAAALPSVVVSSSVGLSQAHNNIQPYLSMVVFIWT